MYASTSIGWSLLSTRHPWSTEQSPQSSSTQPLSFPS
jgi:hypothetical protein